MSETASGRRPTDPLTPDEARLLLEMLFEKHRIAGWRVRAPRPHVQRVMDKLTWLSRAQRAEPG